MNLFWFLAWTLKISCSDAKVAWKWQTWERRRCWAHQNLQCCTPPQWLPQNLWTWPSPSACQEFLLPVLRSARRTEKFEPFKRTHTSTADTQHASLGSDPPLWGHICGGTLLRAPPYVLQHDWPCPGQSPAAEWTEPWRWHRDPGQQGTPRTPEPHKMPRSPGSSPGSKAMRTGHH